MLDKIINILNKYYRRVCVRIDVRETEKVWIVYTHKIKETKKLVRSQMKSQGDHVIEN